MNKGDRRMTPDELIRDILYTDYEDNAQVVTSDNKVVTGVWLRGDNKLVIEVIEERFLSEQENEK
jgi:hypothetical protein